VPNVAQIFNAEQEPNGTLLVLFIPSKDKDGNDLKDQDVWASSAGKLLSDLYGGSTNMPPAQGRCTQRTDLAMSRFEWPNDLRSEDRTDREWIGTSHSSPSLLCERVFANAAKNLT
jgi:hypothetical protein